MGEAGSSVALISLWVGIHAHGARMFRYAESRKKNICISSLHKLSEKSPMGGSELSQFAPCHAHAMLFKKFAEGAPFLAGQSSSLADIAPGSLH